MRFYGLDGKPSVSDVVAECERHSRRHSANADRKRREQLNSIERGAERDWTLEITIAIHDTKAALYHDFAETLEEVLPFPRS